MSDAPPDRGEAARTGPQPSRPDTPLVSVIMPVRNGERTVSQAIESVRCQTLSGWEMIVVDDGSTDATAALVARISSLDGRVRLLRRGAEQVHGPAQSRNAGLREAVGPFVAFIDCDDSWMPGKLESQIQAFEATPGAELCCCDAIWLRDGHPVGTLFAGQEIHGGTEAWKELLADCYVGTPCVVARRETVRRLGGFDERLRVGEDQDLWIRLALAGSVVVVPAALVKYRLSCESYMTRNWNLTLTDWLPHLESHVIVSRPRLTGPEYAAILRTRYWQLGRVHYEHGDIEIALWLFGKAVRHGLGRVTLAIYLLRASHLARWLKERLRRFGRFGPIVDHNTRT